MKVQHNVKLPLCGRKDTPPKKGWINIYEDFPIERLKIGYSFNTYIPYDYGKTISIKNSCRRKANKLGIKMSFSVGKWNDQIRVWRKS